MFFVECGDVWREMYLAMIKKRTASRRRRIRSVNHSAVKQINVAAGLLQPARIVGDDADGCAGRVKFSEHFHERLTAFGVEVAGGFVGEKDGRPAGYRAGDRNQLLMSA
jgi:hypothetical protein